MRKAEIVEIIYTVCVMGKGTPEDPYREVEAYWKKDGTLIFQHDPINEPEHE